MLEIITKNNYSAGSYDAVQIREGITLWDIVLQFSNAVDLETINSSQARLLTGVQSSVMGSSASVLDTIFHSILSVSQKHGQFYFFK